jgi:hypothetical protein
MLSSICTCIIDIVGCNGLQRGHRHRSINFDGSARGDVADRPEKATRAASGTRYATELFTERRGQETNHIIDLNHTLLGWMRSVGVQAVALREAPFCRCFKQFRPLGSARVHPREGVQSPVWQILQRPGSGLSITLHFML